MKLKIIMKNPFTDLGNYKIIKEPKLVIGIETLLNIIFIALQDRKESN